MLSKKTTLSLSTFFLSFTLPLTYAGKPIFPAEIAGRDLAYRVGGFFGHLGITTAPMSSPDGMNQTSDLIIEILNEPVVGQINTLDNFKSRSKFWGTRYGIADRGVRGYNVLVEANHQRWWCPTYTLTGYYVVGSGIPTTGQIIQCGQWRCDTYAWWAFYSAGYNTAPSGLISPSVVFTAFPYTNAKFSPIEQTIKIPFTNNSKVLGNYNAKQLNEMPFEEFTAVADIPAGLETPEHILAEMQFANDEQLDAVKRGMFIDRLTIGGKYPNTVDNLINLYKRTPNEEVKSKIIQGLMIYYQQHIDISQNSNEQQLLKQFFAELIAGDFHNQPADHIVRSFIDLHTPEEVLENRNSIDKLIKNVPHQSSIMLKTSLIRKSRALEKIYIPSMIKELKAANNSDLDSYFFGPLAMAYKANGADFLLPENKRLVVDYLQDVKHKYSSEGIKRNKNDPYVALTAPIYLELVAAIK